MALFVGAAGYGPNVQKINIKLSAAREALRSRGFTVKFLRSDALTLSRLSRVVDTSNKADIYWNSPYDQMLKLLDIARDVKLGKGIRSPMPIHLPSFEQLNLLGADGLRQILDTPAALALFKERVVCLNAGFVDFTILSFIFDSKVLPTYKS